MPADHNNGRRGRVIHGGVTAVVVLLLSLVAASMARADDKATVQPAWRVSCVAPACCLRGAAAGGSGDRVQTGRGSGLSTR
ncbi:hypothetical protein [Alcanivorax sp. S71-1-4]|uniref:hypothetical protein n=1 Tax=Alcanivorax sp. S71-1-4 TaxID=1177159 RepID=UPI0013592051|nr:hypothetical protein [Alcanivorax sp. S71-1-4]